MGQDIRDQLRQDREQVLEGLEALSASPPERGAALERLAALRRCWKVHVLALEAVIYRALESRDAGASRLPEERLVEHKRIDAMFERLNVAKPGTITWRARHVVLREMILHHLESEGDLALRLEKGLSLETLDDLSANYELVRDKLSVLEDAKAA